MLVLGMMLLLALATYDPGDPTPWFSAGASGEPSNWIGRAGAFGAELLVAQGFGIAAFVLPIAFLVAGWRLLWRHDVTAAITKGVGLLLLLVSLSAIATMGLRTVAFSGERIRAGGAVGEVLAAQLSANFGRIGALGLLGLLLFVGLILTTQFSFAEFLRGTAALAADRYTRAKVAFEHARKTRRKERLRQEVIRKHMARAEQDARNEGPPVEIDATAAALIDLPVHAEATRPQVPRPATTGAPASASLPFETFGSPNGPRLASLQFDVIPGPSIEEQAQSAKAFDSADFDFELAPEPGMAPSVPLAFSPAATPAVHPPPTPLVDPVPVAFAPAPPLAPPPQLETPSDVVASPAAAFRRRRPTASIGDVKATEKRGAYPLPPLTLFDPPVASQGFDTSHLTDKARTLESKCKEFGVAGSIVGIHPGPVVTTYEFKPDAGVKYARVVALADDLALALEAESVRIDRISGRGSVGIEIPNDAREMIALRTILDSDIAKRAAGRLIMGLGKTVSGDTYVADLATMPHLLIAGATGTGKSVGLNCIISSILFKTTPDECRMIMIDPKRLELGVYEGIPHLLAPVVTEPKLAANVLKWAVGEMDKRTRMLAAEGVRNIEQFNNIIRSEGSDSGLTLLHYIVIVIDELADLMMVSSKDVEESITRLAQMARAVGIHLILATQRPSVDVITGLIKANFPARISFRVSARVDSRTILDSIGAEQLLGRGDMLFLPPQSSRLVRVHGAYVSEKEIERLTTFLRSTGQPAYDSNVGKVESAASERMKEEDRDELFDECARFVVESGQASTSMLQRRFRIGFSRAGRLIDMMEQDGLIGPGDGAKPREILVAKDYFSSVDSRPE